MRTYLRHRVPGGTYFFTVNLAERKHNDLMSVREPTAAILFFASPKKSIQKKGAPDAAYILRSEAFERGCRKGLLPLRQRDVSLHRPCGLVRSKAPVLGATYGRKNRRDWKDRRRGGIQ